MGFYLKIIFFAFFFIMPFEKTFAQEVNVVPYLKLIEDGKKDTVRQILSELKKQHPNDPSVMFLDAVLTENAQQSLPIYTQVYQNYPKSKYADAALYRVYSYYYAIGIYSSAKKFLAKLKKDYPNSPYLSIINQNIPQRDDSIVSDKKALSNVIVSNRQNEQTNAITGNYKFTIQAGAFSSLDNAKSLSKSFEDAGYFSKIENKSVAGATFHVVYLGRFLNEEDAKKILLQVNSKYNLDGRIVPLN
jgi:hypothetical protein